LSIVLGLAPVLFAILFETPLAALGVLFGAACVPIVIHLLNRNRYRIVNWAAMRFLLAAKRKNTRRLRVEQILLLAMRTLIVVLLVIAMVSVMPWTEDVWHRLFPGRASLAKLSSRRTHKILVIDGSFSMALKNEETSCFDRAIALAARILQESPGGDGFSVLLMASPPRRIVSEPSDDPRRVAEELKGLRLPHGNADLVATFLAVEDMLRKSPEKFQEREVYFLTDLQRSTWTARQTVDPRSTLQKIQTRARTIFLDVGPEGANNLAVTNLALGVPLVTTGAETPISATIHNFGSESYKQRRVELWIGKARETATDPSFQLRLSHQEFLDLVPGQSTTVTFPCRFRAPGNYAVQVRLEPDGLELDDVRSVVVSVKDSVPVMLVNGKPALEVYGRATEWLKDALNPFPGGQAPGHVPARPKVVTESQFADVGLGDLTAYDCVYFCDVARLSAAEVRRLETHLHRGGGVVFCLGPQIDAEAYNRLLYRNGEGILPARVMSRQEAAGNRTYSFLIEEDSYKRPPLEAFAGDNDKLGLLMARFRQYWRVELPTRGPRGPNATPLASGVRILSFIPSPVLSTDLASTPPDAGPTTSPADMAVGDPALIIWSRYRGQVVLFTSTVNMDWTTWPISPSYPAFMQELLRMAVAGRLREQSMQVGDVLEEVLPVGSGGLDVTFHTPDGQVEETRTQDAEDNAVLRRTDTDVSGVYRATIGRHPKEYLFAVNVPAASDSQQGCESDLTRTNADELRAAYPGWEFQLLTDPAKVVHSGGAESPGESGTDWPWRGIGTDFARNLLLAMFLLLLIEVVLAWRFGHHNSGATIHERPPASGRLLPALAAGFAAITFAIVAVVLGHAAWTGDFLGFLPDTLRHKLEADLDIPPPTPGEGSRWRLEYTPYLRDATADPWLVGALAVAAIGLVIIVYMNEGKTARLLYRLILAGLRIELVLLMIAVLLPQLRLLFERQSWPDIAIIIDDSRSMSTRDVYQDPRLRLAVDRLAKLGSISGADRLQLAQILLTRSKPDWLAALLSQNQVKIHVYHCSGRAARMIDVTDPADSSQQAAALDALRELRPEGESSQLGTAVRQVLNDFRGSSLAAIIMLTDGVTTEGEELVPASRYAAQLGVPLFFIGIGDAQEIRDIALHDLHVEDTVYVNDRLVFEVRVTGQGYFNLSVPIRLKEKGKDKVLDAQTVRLDPQGKPVKVRLIHTPTESGEKVYVLEAPGQPGEAQLDNNRIERTIFVRDSKLIKVLYVEGYARYEYRYVKHLLERESAQDLRNKTVDLKVILLDSDSEYAKLDRSALAEFPSKVELNQFDVVILGDIDVSDGRVTKHLSEIADFVRERGGGLLVLAGPRHSPHDFKDTALRDILPVEVVGPEPPDQERRAGFHPELTGTGRFHPIFRFSPDEAENATIWTHLAPIFWWSECYRPKPAAEVLAFHPDRKAVWSSATGSSENRHPLIVQHFAGAGRAMFFGIDETWRWRFREDELRFNQFWIQTVRYLSRNRSGRIELRLNRQTPYRRGEPINIAVRFPDDAPPPGAGIAVKVLVERKFSKQDSPDEVESQSLVLAKVEGSRATYEGHLTRTPEGDYQFWLTSPADAEPRPHAECRVLPPPGEMDRVRMNQQDMERAADETHGHFYTLADADNLLQDLPAGTRVALNSTHPPLLLWNRPAVFLLAMVLLTAEWFLRKRKHLL
jgi:hypothetical protein